MSRSREDIRGMCEKAGIEGTQAYIASMAFVGKEAGWAQEWILDKRDKENRESYDSELLKIAKEANSIAFKSIKITEKSVSISWIAVVASIVSTFIAFVALLWGK